MEEIINHDVEVHSAVVTLARARKALYDISQEATRLEDLLSQTELSKALDAILHDKREIAEQEAKAYAHLRELAVDVYKEPGKHPEHGIEIKKATIIEVEDPDALREHCIAHMHDVLQVDLKAVKVIIKAKHEKKQKQLPGVKVTDTRAASVKTDLSAWEFLCPRCGGELQEGDGFESPNLFCPACNAGWNMLEYTHERERLAEIDERERAALAALDNLTCMPETEQSA
jgi:hypothetical protein